MTKGDFILGVLGSIIASVIYKYGEKVWVYVCDKPIRNVWTWVKSEAIIFGPLKIAHASMPIVIVAVILALAPRSFAPTYEIVENAQSEFPAFTAAGREWNFLFTVPDKLSFPLSNIKVFQDNQGTVYLVRTNMPSNSMDEFVEIFGIEPPAKPHL